MKQRLYLLLAGMLCIPMGAFQGYCAESTKALLGSWSGKVTGPQGGPPTGDVVVTFEKAASGIKGKIIVTAPGGAQYSGQISNIALKNKIFSATATFKLGENPLETQVSGPLKGKTIQGIFAVIAKGQKMGEGTFTITRGPAPAKKKPQ